MLIVVPALQTLLLDRADTRPEGTSGLPQTAE